MKKLVEKLEEDFGMEVLIHTSREYSYEVLHKSIKDYMRRLMEGGREYVYMFASCIVVDDKSVGGEPMDLWIRFYD